MKTLKIVKPNGENLIIEYGIQETESPYFSITGTLYDGNCRGDKHYICGGCIHEEIKKATQSFNDLIALHLSNKAGTPMYAIENGFYFFQIMRGVAKHHKMEQGDEIKYYNILKKHLRTTDEVLNQLSKDCATVQTEDEKKLIFTKLVLELTEQWKKEAEEAIKKHGL